MSVNGSPVANVLAPNEFAWLAGAAEEAKTLTAEQAPAKGLKRQSSIVLRRDGTAGGGGLGGSGPTVQVPVKDGAVLELDPLTASPGALDAVPGLSDSAKKVARDEMARLVSGALAKWSIG